MNTMTSLSSQYTDLNDFLIKHNASKTAGDKKSVITHTRIGNAEMKIYGGSYSIPKEELPIFYNLYYEHIFVKNRKEYLTEKQLNSVGPIVIDLDFHYNISVHERLHTQEHIQDIISLYLEELKNIYVFEPGNQFPIFVMEKPNVNRVVEKSITKDGIHIIIGLQMDNVLQTILRRRVLAAIRDVIELPLVNDWDAVLDEGISQGGTNWQLYGSQKPGHEAYRVTYYMTAELDPTDNEWMTKPKNPKDIDLSKDFKLLSAQYDGHLACQLKEDIKKQYEAELNSKAEKKKSSSKGKVNITYEQEESQTLSLEDIVDHETLKKAVDSIMDNLKIKEQYIKETHQYTQILPEKYYEPGSHYLNRQVAFALKATDDRLFLSWVMLRSKASDFDFATIPKLYHDWKTYFNSRQDGITRRSIIYWAKQDAFKEWEKVKSNTIDHYIEETIFDAGDWDYAMVLFHMFKDKYVCSSIVNKTWHVYNNHRWELDQGMRLRLAISKDLFELYSEKQSQYLSEAQQYETSDERHEKLQRKTKKIAEICLKLKKTNDKNNIMREAMEIFYDKDFTTSIDSNPYLMGFKNGVFDFKNKEFRQGYPQDYISKCAGVAYVPYDYESTKEISDEINEFMDQLFPIPSLCQYMWDHLASCLIGVKKEHAFNIYRGSGSNGKSLLTDLMSKALDQYKGIVPVTLVTDKRSALGSATPEIMSLKGVRYAVMQELSKGSSFNEGIMKELTGGDAMTGRSLFCNSETFIPQFSLIICTNELFEVKSNDDGTWRRMKLVDFLSKFVSEGDVYNDDTKYVFPKNKDLKDKKLPLWAPIFMSMLVKRACETEGEVIDCPEVTAASCKYRQSQDSITSFINEKIVKNPNGAISKKYLNDVFKEFYQANFNDKKPPKLSDIEEVMTKRFGKRDGKTNKWMGIAIREDEEPTDDLDNVL